MKLFFKWLFRILVLAALVLFVPFSRLPFAKPPIVKVRVYFASYACGECALSESYIIDKVLDGGPRLLGRDIVLYYKGGYFREKADFKKLDDYDRSLKVTCALRGRNLFDVIFEEPFSADVLAYQFAD